MKGTIRIDFQYLDESGSPQWLSGTDVDAEEGLIGLKRALADLDIFMAHEHRFTLAEGFE